MTSRTGAEGFEGDAIAWTAVVAGRVPSYVGIIRELVALLGDPAAGPPVRAVLEQVWAGRSFSAVYDRPLLVLAALRADALELGEGHPLWAAVAAEPPRAEAVTRAALGAALASPSFLARLRSRRVQTNETSRAVTWTWPAHLLGGDGGARPLVVADVGTSAGLNLVADRLPAPWRDGAGAPLPTVQGARIERRVGIDLDPLDVRRPEDVRWLEACIWPGEPARLDRLRAAVAAMRAAHAEPAPPLILQAEAAAAPALLDQHLAGLPPSALKLVCQTIMIDYLPAPARAAYVAAMEGWLARTREAVWLQLEQEAGPDPGHPATIRAVLRGRGDAVVSLLLARTGYHPATVAVEPDGVHELRARAALSPA